MNFRINIARHPETEKPLQYELQRLLSDLS